MEKGKQVFQLTIENKDISDRVGDWIRATSDIREQGSGKISAEDIESDCQYWEGQYPKSLAAWYKAKLEEEKNSRSKKPTD